MSLHPRSLFNAVVLGTAVALLAGCGMSAQEQTEAAATVLKSNNRMQGRLIAYSSYTYSSGKATNTERATTLVPDLAACQMHGEYQALESQMRYSGREVKLSCLGLDGSIAGQFTCIAENNNPSCRSFSETVDRPDDSKHGVKYPKLD